MGDQQQQMEPAGELLARIDESVAAQWRRVNAAATAATHYTSRELPLSRIKRIMKQDSCLNARLVGADATSAAAYASELFIEWIVTRAWEFTLHARRRTLQRRDLLDAILSEEKLDMLIDVIEGAVEAEAEARAAGEEEGQREAKRARRIPPSAIDLAAIEKCAASDPSPVSTASPPEPWWARQLERLGPTEEAAPAQSAASRESCASAATGK